MITLLVLLIDSIRVTLGYSEIIIDYDALFKLGISEFLIIVILFMSLAMYHDFRE